MKQSIQITCLLALILSFCTATLAQRQTNDNRRLQEIGRKLEHTGRELLRIIDTYSQQVTRNPNDAAAFNNRAAAYFERGDYRQAIMDYSNAIRLYNTSQHSHMARMHYKRGLCYYILGEYASAEKDFSSAIQYRPDAADSYYFRGKIRKIIYRNLPSARGDLNMVLRKSSTPTVQGAFAKLLLGQREQGINDARRIMNAIPRVQRDNYALMSYNYAGLLALSGQTQESLKYLQQALDYGYDDYQWLIRDINFLNLRYNRDFTYLLQRYGLKYMGTGEVEPGEPNEPYDRPYTQNQDRPRGYPTNTSNINGTALRFTDGNGNKMLESGEMGYISFRLTNDGSAKASQVQVLLIGEENADGLKYTKTTNLGDFYPGESRTIRLSVQGTSQMPNGDARFEVRVVDRNGNDAEPMTIDIPLDSYKPPILEVVDHHFASEMGGRMRPGVPATLKIAVQNLGQGVAEGVLLDFELGQEVFTAGADKFDLGDIQPGENRVVDLEFFTSRKYAKEDVVIKALIRDAKKTYSQRQTFIVKVNQELEVRDRVIINASPISVKPDPNKIELNSDVDTDLPRTGNRNPDAIAVVIGNRDYLNTDVPPVDYALQDAAAMKKYLEESYGFDPNNIIFMTNATQADFNGTFGTKGDHKARLFNLVKENQSDVFVFYSGHGAPDLESEEAYFVPVDCDPSLVRFNGYAINTFYENLSKIPYKSLTVVIDACFSGTSANGTLIPRASLVRIKSKPTSILTDPKAVVFTSTTGTQIASWYPDEAHGLFTYYFLKGLQGEANTDRDRELTLSEMRNYLNDKVPYEARRMNNRVQTPEYFGTDGATILDY
ncbi:MAG: caspase family protein [Bacteroidota bacterium]